MGPALSSEEVYEALVCEDSLANLLERIAETVGGRSSLMISANKDGPPETRSSHFFGGNFIADYTFHWAQHDPWLIEGFKPQNNIVFGGLHRIVSEERFERSDIYNQWLKHDLDDTFHCAALKVAAPNVQGAFSIQRGRSAGAFEDEDLAPLRPRLDDLSRLMRLRGELAAARRREAEAKSAMDRLTLALFTVRRDGHCKDLNAAAGAVVLRGDGLTLRRDRLTAVAPDAAEPLRAALERATARQNPQASSLVIVRPPPLRPYLATVSPLRTKGASLALIVLRDPEAAGRSAEDRLRQLFGLSPAEASLAVALAQGLTPEDMADTRRVSLATIRTQLRAVSEKMGCNRLAQVAAIVARLPPI